MASTVVGLDIGRTAVRAVELRGKNPTLRRHGSIELGRGAVETGVLLISVYLGNESSPLLMNFRCRGDGSNPDGVSIIRLESIIPLGSSL